MREWEGSERREEVEILVSVIYKVIKNNFIKLKNLQYICRVYTGICTYA